MCRFDAFLGDECDVTLLDNVASVFTLLLVHSDSDGLVLPFTEKPRAGPGSYDGSFKKKRRRSSGRLVNKRNRTISKINPKGFYKNVSFWFVTFKMKL